MTAADRVRLRPIKSGSWHAFDASLRQGGDKHTAFTNARLRGHTNEYSVRRVQRSANMGEHISSVLPGTTRYDPVLTYEERSLARSYRSKHVGD